MTVLYYILNIIWGLPMTLIGGLISLVLLILGKKPKRYHGAIYFEVGHGWSGVNFGLFFVCAEDVDESVKSHEFGHSLQNCMFGPLMPILVSVPSVMRYWYRKLRYHSKGLKPPTEYDDAWFEGQATEWGNDYKELF